MDSWTSCTYIGAGNVDHAAARGSLPFRKGQTQHGGWPCVVFNGGTNQILNIIDHSCTVSNKAGFAVDTKSYGA